MVSLDRAAAFVLAKQGLAGDGLADVLDATHATAGIYGTAPTCYLSCAARVDGFVLSDLDTELYETRRLVRLRAMRQSSYIVPLETVQVVMAATGPRVELRKDFLLRASGLDERAYGALADQVETVLAGRTATVPELRKLLGPRAPDGREALQFTVALMARLGRLVRAEVRGSWRSDTYAYARWEEWVGAPVARAEADAARAELARLYLRAFGPATAEDLRWWTGWTAKEAAAALDALGDGAVAVALTASAGPAAGFVLSDEADRLAAAPATPPATACLLPVWDAYLMGYRQRARFVSDRDYPLVYDASGNATSVVLLDGRAGGVWEFAAPPDPGREMAVRVAPFRPLTGRGWRDIAAAVARLAASIGAADVRVDREPPPLPLADGVRNAFLAPIRLGAKSPSGR